MLHTKIEAYSDNGYTHIDPDLFQILLKVIKIQPKEEISVKKLVDYFQRKLRVVDQIAKVIFQQQSGYF